jgi:3-hydroxyacyl-CoA dehydrogenase/enoyl-CoA hydratase/3-hydroxybutyryl-CoA epimerase
MEDAASKRARFIALGRVMPKEAVLASCASEPGLEELFAATIEPGRVIGLGFFDPVGPSRQIQMTIGSQTTRETALRVMAFIATLDKTPVVNGKARRTP